MATIPVHVDPAASALVAPAIELEQVGGNEAVVDDEATPLVSKVLLKMSWQAATTKQKFR